MNPKELSLPQPTEKISNPNMVSRAIKAVAKEVVLFVRPDPEEDLIIPPFVYF